MSVLDLPQMYQRPSYDALRSTLEALKLAPPVWKPRVRHQQQSREGKDEGKGKEQQHVGEQEEVLEREAAMAVDHHRADVTRYLSGIIKSPLSWINDDAQKDYLWELASRRMSERCGRSAMGEMVRAWPFVDDDPFELVIREPALTGDLLGFKTWGSSYALARHLPELAQSTTGCLAGLLPTGQHGDAVPRDEDKEGHPSVLELGSGTGLLGLAAAALWRTHVALSDLPPIMANLGANAETNRPLIEQRGGRVSVGPLTWGGAEHEIDQTLFGKPHQFKVVLAADPLYDDNHPALLASAIGQHLALEAQSRAVVMVPQRDATTVGLLESFKQAMLRLDRPLLCVREDELAGADDWVDDDEAGHVCCWLGVFSRGQPPSSAAP